MGCEAEKAVRSANPGEQGVAMWGQKLEARNFSRAPFTPDYIPCSAREEGEEVFNSLASFPSRDTFPPGTKWSLEVSRASISSLCPGSCTWRKPLQRLPSLGSLVLPLHCLNGCASARQHAFWGGEQGRTAKEWC